MHRHAFVMIELHGYLQVMQQSHPGNVTAKPCTSGEMAPSTHWTNSSVGPQTSMVMTWYDKEKNSALPRIKPQLPSPQTIILLIELFQLTELTWAFFNLSVPHFNPH